MVADETLISISELCSGEIFLGFYGTMAIKEMLRCLTRLVPL